EVEIISIIEHSRPLVVVCRDGLAERDRHFGETEAVSKLFCNIFVALMVYFTLCNVCVSSFDTEYVSCILLVCDADVNIFAKLAHDLSGFLFGPQLVAVVQIAGDSETCFFCSLTCVEADRSDLIVECRCDACEVEPLS